MQLAEFQMGLAKLALGSGNLSSSQVFGAIRQAMQRAPHYPECHNLTGLVYEAQRRICRSFNKKKIKKNGGGSGGTVDSVVPWLSDTACSSLLPLWPMAHLEGTPIQRINHFLTFGAYDYFQRFVGLLQKTPCSLTRLPRSSACGSCTNASDKIGFMASRGGEAEEDDHFGLLWY
ncbi:hypothetical protein PRUPE_4G218400 [Prunus persica]|uniref:Uncharacterized protein n=1 Tax=Prunus persica TaxID=3760 RepID=A0A251PP98_PRUPE|nr:hypothetical protein PRUPE_4G218400 [Prunus persica]